MDIIEADQMQKNGNFIMEDNILKGLEEPSIFKSFNLGEVLLDAFDKNPNHISQIDALTDEKRTYAEMKDRSIRCALWFEKEGISCDDLIGLCIPKQLDSYIPVLGAYYVQAIINPWHFELELEEARCWLKIFTPKMFFASPDAANVLEKMMKLENYHAKIIVVGKHPKYQSLDDILNSQSSSDVENYRPRTIKSSKDVVAIVTTSGTTGFPKGVMISSESLLRNASYDNFPWRNKIVMPFGLPGGINYHTTLIVSILKNATRIIFNKYDAREVCRIIEKYKVTYLNAGPKFLTILASYEGLNDYNLDSLEILRTGGLNLHEVIHRKVKSTCLGNKLQQVYGASEIGTTRFAPKFGKLQTDPRSIGFVTPNLQLKIVDRRTQKTLGPNNIGEMVIKSPALSLGYYRNPKATSKAFDADGWFHTGDIGYFDEKGEVYFIDRLAGAFEYRGQEIFSSEIEGLFLTHPAVNDVAVVSLPHESDGEIPVAFVGIKSGKNVTQEELTEVFSKFSKCNNLHGRVYFMNEVPRTYSTKPAKSYLKKLAIKLTKEHELSVI